MMPPGATTMYINVDQGKKIQPRIGQIQVWKSWLVYAGLKIHQTNMANLGPNN
jgi:hypothetical protein